MWGVFFFGEFLYEFLWILFCYLGGYQNSGSNHIGVVFNKLIKHIGSPVDFQLPDWVNKSRPPMAYTSIKRSILFHCHFCFQYIYTYTCIYILNLGWSDSISTPYSGVRCRIIARPNHDFLIVIYILFCLLEEYPFLFIGFVDLTNFKIYIWPRRLKNDWKMMVYSAPALGPLGYVVGIAIVGKLYFFFLMLLFN